MKEIVLTTNIGAMISMLEREKIKLEQFAEENGLSLSMMTQKVREIYDDLSREDLNKPEDERLSDVAKEIRAYRRARHAFKREARSLQKSVDGMIVCRYPDNDFLRNRYRYCMRTAADNKEKALQQGLINEAGEPIYNGEVLDKNNLKPYGRALGYTISKDDEGNEEMHPFYAVIDSTVSEKVIPVCQIGKIAINEGDSQQKNFRYAQGNDVWYNAGAINDGQKAPYTESEINNILGQWSKAFALEDYDIPTVKTFEELSAFKEQHASKERGDEYSFDFVFAPMIVQGVTKKEGDPYSDVNVILEMMEDTPYTQTISLFMVPEHLQGLKMEPGMAGIAVLQSLQHKKGKEPYWHLGGFLPADEEVNVAKFFR